MPTRQDYQWLRDHILDVYSNNKAEQAHYSYIAWKIHEENKEYVDKNLIPEDIKHEYYRSKHLSKIVQRQCNRLVKEGKLIKRKRDYYPGARYHFRPRTVVYALPGESS